MSSTDGRGIDEFLAEVDAAFDRLDVEAAQAQRVHVDDLPAGTVLWRIARESPEPWREERITSRDDGFWYEAAAPADGDEDRWDSIGACACLGCLGCREYVLDTEVLTFGPWPTIRSLVQWHPEVLRLFDLDEVSVCGLSHGILAEFLSGTGGDTYLAGESWYIGSGAAVTECAEPIASWDNGDNYAAPGGDRLYHLYRFDDFYVAFDDESFVAEGHFDSEEEAIRAWAESYVPGGFDEYERDDEYDEDDEYDDGEASPPWRVGDQITVDWLVEPLKVVAALVADEDGQPVRREGVPSEDDEVFLYFAVGEGGIEVAVSAYEVDDHGIKDLLERTIETVVGDD